MSSGTLSLSPPATRTWMDKRSISVTMNFHHLHEPSPTCREVASPVTSPCQCLAHARASTRGSFPLFCPRSNFYLHSPCRMNYTPLMLISLGHITHHRNCHRSSLTRWNQSEVEHFHCHGALNFLKSARDQSYFCF